MGLIVPLWSEVNSSLWKGNFCVSPLSSVSHYPTKRAVQLKKRNPQMTACSRAAVWWAEPGPQGGGPRLPQLSPGSLSALVHHYDMSREHPWTRERLDCLPSPRREAPQVKHICSWRWCWVVQLQPFPSMREALDSIPSKGERPIERDKTTE